MRSVLTSAPNTLLIWLDLLSPLSLPSSCAEHEKIENGLTEGKTKQKSVERTIFLRLLCTFNLSSFLFGSFCVFSFCPSISALSSLTGGTHSLFASFCSRFLRKCCVCVLCDFVFICSTYYCFYLYVNFKLRGERTVESPLFSHLISP